VKALCAGFQQDEQRRRDDGQDRPIADEAGAGTDQRLLELC
jgi:hypothetical protein